MFLFHSFIRYALFLTSGSHEARPRRKASNASSKASSKVEMEQVRHYEQFFGPSHFFSMFIPLCRDLPTGVPAPARDVCSG